MHLQIAECGIVKQVLDDRVEILSPHSGAARKSWPPDLRRVGEARTIAVDLPIDLLLREPDHLAPIETPLPFLERRH